MNSDQQMIAKQAEIITKHRETITRLDKEIESLRAKLAVRIPASEAWFALQQQIATNDTLQNEWDRFLIVLRMAGEEDYIKINYRGRQN